MKMKKLLFLSVLVGFSFCNKGLGQSLKVDEWYLEYLYQSLNLYSSYKSIGQPLLWDSNQSKSFLLKKLKSTNKVTTIMLMGLSKDTSFVKEISQYIDDADKGIARVSLESIARIGGPEAANLLNQAMIRRSANPIEAQQILGFMQFLADTSTMQSINYYLRTIQPINEKNEKLSAMANDVMETIVVFNKSALSKRQLVISNLDDNEKFGWSIFQLYKLKDTMYLEDLRKIQASFKNLPSGIDGKAVSNTKYDKILMLRLFLKDEKLTTEEEAYVAKNPKIWPLEKRNELVLQEIEFLKKNGYNKD